MLDRLNPFKVLTDHWGYLEDRSRDGQSDRAAKVVLLGAPTAVAVVVFLTGTTLNTPSALVGALSLFSAGLLAAFAQIASIRARYPSPESSHDPDKPTRQMMDEAVAHVLTAALLSVSTAVLIVVGMNVGDGEALNRYLSTVVAFMGIYLFLIFVMTVRKLYAAYVVANDVRENKLFHR